MLFALRSSKTHSCFPPPPEPKVGENEQQLALEDLQTAVVERSKEVCPKAEPQPFLMNFDLCQGFSLMSCVMRLCCNGRHLFKGHFHWQNGQDDITPEPWRGHYFGPQTEAEGGAKFPTAHGVGASWAVFPGLVSEPVEPGRGVKGAESVATILVVIFWLEYCNVVVSGKVFLLLLIILKYLSSFIFAFFGASWKYTVICYIRNWMQIPYSYVSLLWNRNVTCRKKMAWNFVPTQTILATLADCEMA